MTRARLGDAATRTAVLDSVRAAVAQGRSPPITIADLKGHGMAEDLCDALEGLQRSSPELSEAAFVAALLAIMAAA